MFYRETGCGSCRPGACEKDSAPWETSTAPIPQAYLLLGGEEVPYACMWHSSPLLEKVAQGSFFSLLALRWWGTWHVEGQLRTPDHDHRVCFCWRIWHLSQRLPSCLLQFPNLWLYFSDIKKKYLPFPVYFAVPYKASELLLQVPRAMRPL